MITLEQLTDNIEFLKKRHNQIDRINDLLFDFNPDFPTYFPQDDSMEDRLVDSLERELGDESHYLSYFIYDLDFGAKEGISVWDEKDNPIPLFTVQDVLNAIEKDKNAKRS